MLITNFIVSFFIAFIVQFSLFRNGKFSLINSLIFAIILTFVEYIVSLIKIETMENIELPDPISVNELRDPNLKIDSNMETPDDIYLNTNQQENKVSIKVKSNEDDRKPNNYKNKTAEDITSQFSVLSPKYWLDNDNKCNMKCGSPQPVVMDSISNLVNISNIKNLIK